MSGAYDAQQLRQAQQQQEQQRRASILAKTHGGHEGPTGYTTDFTASHVGGLDGLRAMIESANPDVLDNVATNWAAIKKGLLAAQADFQTHTSAALQHWEGSAADGFATRAQQLHDSLGNGALYADNAHTGVTSAATALRAAQKAMPKDPSEWQKISRKATSETSDSQFNADLKSGMSRQVALELDGGNLSATEEAHQRAIVVMQTLEGSYAVSAKTIGPAPGHFENQTVWPPPPATVTHDPVTDPDGGTPAGPNAPGSLRLAEDGNPSNGGSEYGLTPGQSTGGSEIDPGGVGDGISGGEKLPPEPQPGTTLTGVDGGLGATYGGASGGPGGVSVGSVSGLGGGDGNQNGSGSGYGLIGSAAGLGGAAYGGAAGAGATGALADEYGEGMARSAAGSGFVEEESDQSTAGVGAGEDSESEMGMGGMPGGMGGQGKKRKRRPRPHYLVEDPEHWASGVTANPPVIM